MKIVLILAAVCALGLAVPTPQMTKSIPKKFKIDDQVLLQRTEQIQRLLRYVNQPTYFKDLVDVAETFQPWMHADLYTDQKYVVNFFHYYDHDILPRGEIFSVFYQEHLKPMIALFKLFYYAKDYDTFFKTAVWARQHVNEGIFLYAVSVAITHRLDTYGVVLPPIYEVYPYYFFSTEVIHKAQTYKQLYHGEYPKTDTYEGYTIESNYSGWYINLHPEQSLSYFTEDIGLNAFYYYYNIYYPYWMDGEEFGLTKDRRGEVYFFMHQQLLARYYLERLSNGFGEIDILHYDWPIETGYYPSLQYPSGLEFPSRPNHVSVARHWEYNHPHYSNFTNAFTYVGDFARRIRDSIDLGFLYKSDGTKASIHDEHGLELLANTLEGTPNSANLDYYGVIEMYARHLLGYTHTPLHKYKLIPSAMEHFETSLRDPVFWQFYKWIVSYIYELKNHSPHYTKEQLEVQGVEIDSLEIDRLITYFDYFYSQMGQAVSYSPSEFTAEPFKIRVKQERLNHKPFSYKIGVNSQKPMDVIGKVFIGPKFDEYHRPIEINENRMNFVLIDKFLYTLKPGHNVVERNSKNNFYVSDRTSFYDLYKRVLTSIHNHEEFAIDGSEAFWGFPNRLMLPKGTFGGQTFQLYVIFYPYKKTTTTTKMTDEIVYPRVGSGIWDVDPMDFGYPFDRPIDYGTFKVTNSYIKDVVIFHKDYKDLNTTH